MMNGYDGGSTTSGPKHDRSIRESDSAVFSTGNRNSWGELLPDLYLHGLATGAFANSRAACERKRDQFVPPI